MDGLRARDREFREAAHRIVDWIGDLIETRDRMRVIPSSPPGAVRARLPKTPPIESASLEHVFEQFVDDIMPGMVLGTHPGFMAYFSSSASPPGILGELLTAAINSNGMLWRSSPAGVELEEVATDWVRQLLGLPAAFKATLTDGGSTSNLYALTAARERAYAGSLRHAGLYGAIPARIYCSTECHSSVDKAAMTLGLGLNAISRVPVNRDLSMDVRALAHALERDRHDGVPALAVVATIGTTSTAAVDSIDEIAATCNANGVWLHIDASYGGAVAIDPEYRHLVRGWERADSIVVNPHKWFFVPLDCSALYLRDREELRRAFAYDAEYLKVSAAETDLNPMDYGIALGRRTRALKLWYALVALGSDAIAARIREHMEAAQWLADKISASADFELLAPVPLSVVAFRSKPSGINPADLDDYNSRLLDAINAGGEFFLSHTRVRGAFALRAAINNLATERQDVEKLWNALQARA